MLDLEPGVHLKEADRAVRRHEEFAGACADVARLAEDRLGRVVELLDLRVGKERCRGFLDQLLMPPLQRAVPGGDHDHSAVLVGQALRLYVPGPVQVPLDEALAVAERRGGLADRRLVQLGNLLEGAGDLEPAPAAAEGRLDRDRQAMLASEVRDLFRAADRAVGARRERCADALGDLPRLYLVAERHDGRRGRSDPGQAARRHGLREGRVLGEEPVAGVNGIGAGPRRDRDDLFDVQVGLCRGGAVERVGLVGGLDMQGVEVLVGVNGDAGQARVTTCTRHPQGNLAAVRDQDFPQFSPQQTPSGRGRPPGVNRASLDQYRGMRAGAGTPTDAVIRVPGGCSGT